MIWAILVVLVLVLFSAVPFLSRRGVGQFGGHWGAPNREEVAPLAFGNWEPSGQNTSSYDRRTRSGGADRHGYSTSGARPTQSSLAREALLPGAHYHTRMTRQKASSRKRPKVGEVLEGRGTPTAGRVRFSPVVEVQEI